MSNSTLRGAVGGEPDSRHKGYSTSERNELHRKLDQLSLAEKKMKHGDGIKDLGQVIDRALHDYMDNGVNIAVTGSSGAGKSSLINSLRALRSKDKGAAASGTTETTMELAPYPFPDNPNVVLWDLPGVGTPKFPQKDYVETVGLARFQALLICTYTRFTESDVWLVEQARINKVSCYIVRTKVDQDITNTLQEADSEDDEDDVEKTVLDDIRESMRKYLRKLGHQIPQIYLLSTRLDHQTKWEFADLIKALAENAPEKDQKKVLMLLVSCSKDIIEAKMKSLKEGIDHVATRAAAAPDREYREIIIQEVAHYMKWFGVSDDQLQRVNVKLVKLDQRLQDMRGELDKMMNEKVEEYTGNRDYYGWIPLVGNALGRWWDDGVNLEREQERADKYKELSREVENRTPLAITNGTISLLESFLDMCVELAMGILAEREMRA